MNYVFKWAHAPRLLAALMVVSVLLASCGGAGTAPAVPVQEPEPTVQPEVVVEPTIVAEPVENVPVQVDVATATELPTDAPPSPTPEPTVVPTAAKPKSIRETENILVMGVDQRPGDRAWRTDSLMIVGIDYEANQVGIISLPRDLWVEIPGYGMGRINQADFQGESHKYPGGGPALLGKVIEDNLGIPTHHWMRIKMEGLVELVDALGGVTVHLDCPLHEITPHPSRPNEYVAFDLPAGDVTLNGLEAKKFATYRYNSNDFSRARRQQQLVWSIKEQVLQVGAIAKIPELWRALDKTFKTDLSLLDVIRLAKLGSKLEPNQVHGHVFSTKAIVQTVVGGGAQVLIVNDRKLLEQEMANLFQSKSIAEQGREGTGKCETPKLPTVTVTPTP